MKRDLELIRKIVLAVEDSEGGRVPQLTFEGLSSSEVGYHAYLLVDAGIARGVDVTTMQSEGPQALITDLTWAGHEFAALVRDDKRWKRAMDLVNSRGASTFDELKRLLDLEVRAQGSSSHQFEREVAAIYRALGARVEQDVVVAGNQIDVVAEEETASGSRIKTVIECKNYGRPVGVEIVNQFAPLLGLFKDRGLADKGTIVASEGFTKQARA